jgi:hypothetical protein
LSFVPEKRSELTIDQKVGPPAPVFLFNPAGDVSAPIKNTISLDPIVLWKLSEAQCLAQWKERETATDEEKKELHWAQISGMSLSLSHHTI